MNNRWTQFDGLRAFALIVIIASHTAALGMYGQGSVCVNIFFLMSGFFCTRPMEKNGEERFSHIKEWFKFYILKLARILPVYWALILFIYWVSDTVFPTWQNMVKNMFFLNSYAHLWFLQHDMLGYVFVPVIMAFIYLLKKKFKIGNAGIGCILLVVSVALSYYLLHISKLYLWWNTTVKRPIYSGFLLIGMAVGYFVKALHGVNFRKKILYYGLDVVELLLLLTVSVLTSARFLSVLNPALAEYYIGWNRQVTCALICAMLIFVAAINTEGNITKILQTKILVKIGQASLGVYLIHYYLLEFIKLIPIKKFALILLLSCCFAIVSYEYMEKPLYNKVKKVITK